MNKKHILGIFLIAILLVTAGFYLLPFPKTQLYYWGFFSLIFSFLVVLASPFGAVFLKGGKETVFYGASLSTVTSFYLVAVVISLFFINSFEKNLKGFIFIQIAINSIFFILVILIGAFSRVVYQRSALELKKRESGEYDKPKRGGF